MLKYRLPIGILLVAALIGLLWLDEHVAARGHSAGLVMLPVVVLLLIMAGRELARILREKSIAAATGMTCLAAGLGLLTSMMRRFPGTSETGAALVSSGAIIVLVVSLMYYARKRNAQGTVAAAGGALLSFVYVGLMLGFVMAIRIEFSAWALLWVLVVTKSCDIGAYFTGRAIGRRKLIPWLSPGKTWEGLWGGIITAAAVGAGGLALLEYLVSSPKPPVWLGALMGASFAIVGQAGDLLESLFKRDAGRKDSGQSLPGFGGVLDVLDSVLLVAPVAYWWLRLA